MAMDRYCRFEKKFPFYRMDINGYMMLLKIARINSYTDADPPVFEYQIKDMKWKEIKAAFRKH